MNKNLAVTVGGDQTVRFWDMLTKTQFMINKAHDHWVMFVRSNEKYVFTAGLDSTICVFDLEGNLVTKFQKQKKGISSFILKDSMIYSGSRDGTVLILKFDESSSSLKNVASWRHSSQISSIAISSLYIFTADKSGRIKSHSTKTYEYVSELKGHNSKVNCMEAQDDLLITGDDSGNILVFKGDGIKFHLKHKREVISISISPNKLCFASTGFDKTVKLWSLETGVLFDEYFHIALVYKVKFLDDLVISCSKDKRIRMYRPSQKKVINNLVTDDEIYDFDILKDECLICALKNSKVYFYSS